jgi:hypothetical protein
MKRSILPAIVALGFALPLLAERNPWTHLDFQNDPEDSGGAPDRARNVGGELCSRIRDHVLQIRQGFPEKGKDS